METIVEDKANPGTVSPPRLIRGLEALPYYVRFFRDSIGCMRDAHRKHGELTVLGHVLPHEKNRLNVLISGPAYIRQVLGDPEYFRTMGQTLPGPENSAQRRLRFGLTRMQGAQHKQQRKLVMPPFHKKAVEGYHQIMVKTADDILNEWRPGTVRNLYREMRNIALRLASTVLFSSEPGEAFRIGSMIEKWLHGNFTASVGLFPFDLPGTPYRRILRHAEKLERLILSMIEQRRKNPEGRTDVLSILTQARDDENHGMTDTELVGQTTILFGASYETTASTLTWTLFLLAQHPKILHELMDELDTVLGGAPPRSDQLSQLPFLERVIKESMRILPPVPWTVRTTMTDVKMGGHDIPKNSRVICGIFLTHHQPDLYPEPEKFWPDRWLTIDPSQYEYMPFSAGPRACIGAIFAMQAMKISISMVLQRFRLQVVDRAKIERAVRVTMSPRYDIPVKIFAQDRNFSRSKVRGNISEMVEME